jgi:hypothetical protein
MKKRIQEENFLLVLRTTFDSDSSLFDQSSCFLLNNTPQQQSVKSVNLDSLHSTTDDRKYDIQGKVEHRTVVSKDRSYM